MRVSKQHEPVTHIELNPREAELLKQMFESVGYGVYPPDLDPLAEFLGVGHD